MGLTLITLLPLYESTSQAEWYQNERLNTFERAQGSLAFLWNPLSSSSRFGQGVEAPSRSSKRVRVTVGGV